MVESLLSDVESDRENSEIKVEVLQIKGVIDSLIPQDGSSGELDGVWKYLETSENTSFDQNTEPNDVRVQELQSSEAREVFVVRKQLIRLRRKLEREFPDYIEANVSLPIMRKMAQKMGFEDDIIHEYAESACEAVGLSKEDIQSVENVDDRWSVRIGKGRSSILLSINEELLLDGIYPEGHLATECPYMSKAYFFILWFPIFKEIGHFSPNNGKVMLDSESGSSCSKEAIADFSGFDTSAGTPISFEIFVSGEGSRAGCRTEEKKISQAGYARRVEESLMKRLQQIKGASLVKVNMPGTTYDGLAGEVVIEGLKLRNDHVEVPVKIKYENGFENTVVFTDDDLSIYIE